MRPNKNKIYNHLITFQQRFGGYTGKDLDDIARKLGFDRRTIKRNVEKWSNTDPSFAELEYIGKHSIIITLEDIAIINQRLKEKITSKKQDIIPEINDTRVKQGYAAIPQSTLYRIINNLRAALSNGAPQELHWLAIQGIEVSSTEWVGYSDLRMVIDKRSRIEYAHSMDRQITFLKQKSPITIRLHRFYSICADVNANGNSSRKKKGRT